MLCNIVGIVYCLLILVPCISHRYGIISSLKYILLCACGIKESLYMERSMYCGLNYY